MEKKESQGKQNSLRGQKSGETSQTPTKPGRIQILIEWGDKA
jgi:hypothetical protein